MKTSLPLTLLSALLFAPALHAHITLDQKSAPSGSYYRGVFKVGHGCDGSPTTSITVRIPDGVRSVKPQPKAGWTLERTMQKLATPYLSHGKTISEGVSEIVWRGGPLADEHYDEFMVHMQLPERAGPLWFKVLQQCEKGQTDWAEIPAQGIVTRGLKAPAALLELTTQTSAGAAAPTGSAPTAKPADAHKH